MTATYASGVRQAGARLGLGLALILLVSASGLAQKKKGEAPTRTVEGAVSFADDAPVNGAVVQLKNAKTLQIRSFITQKDGNYYFRGLSLDVDYELKAEYNGTSSGSKTLSTFDSRKDAIINLKLNAKK